MEDGRRPKVLVHVEGVGKTYRSPRGTVEALRSVSLTVAKGEFVSLLGPSGCGKSTLVMMMAGLVSATRGQVRIDGRAVRRPHTELGIVFQQDLLVDWRTILGNVMLQIDVRKLDRAAWSARAHALLDLVGLRGFEDRYPHELSGGMRQRVAICRALVHNPALVLMDEPFGALDALTREQMNLDLLKIWNEQAQTIVFVTHSIGEAVFLSDRIIVMSVRPGQVLEEISVDLPRPRRLAMRESLEFTAYARRIRQVLARCGVLKEEEETA